MYAIPLAECMKFHWQNICNSTGRMYAVPLATCMWFHLDDATWPKMLHTSQQQWASPTASEQKTEDDSATVQSTLMQCKSYPPACTYYCDLDPMSTSKMVVTNPNSLLGYFPFDAWQGRRKKRSISLVERESSIDNEKGILHPSLQSHVARFLHSFPKPPILQCSFVSTSSYFPSSNPISHPSIPKEILLPLTHNTFFRM